MKIYEDTCTDKLIFRITTVLFFNFFEKRSYCTDGEILIYELDEINFRVENT